MVEDLTSQKYKVIRFSFKGRRRVVRRNLTLDQAQSICRSPESSSRTAQGVSPKASPWFYGYERDASK
jgi:hypothetical protein